VVRSLLAPVPPRTSVLPPGAGNEEAKKALKTDDEGAKKTEDRTVRETSVVQGHLDTPAIRANRDGDVASIATIEQTQDWSPASARTIRAVRAVYEAFSDRATSGRWRRGAPPRTSVGRPLVRSRRYAALGVAELGVGPPWAGRWFALADSRPLASRSSALDLRGPAAGPLSQIRGDSGCQTLVARDRRSPDGLFPTNLTLVEGDSLPALPSLENQGGAGQSGQDQNNPEGLSLQHPSHLIKTSAGRRRG